MSKIKSYLLNDQFILTLIIINALLIFLEEFGMGGTSLDYLEGLFTIIFIVEMIIKVKHYGFKKYISNGWNRFDFILVVLTIPSLAALFFDQSSMEFNIFLSLRVFRAFKAFRLLKFLPQVDNFTVSVRRAIKSSYVILFSFFILIFIISLISTSLYRNIAPEYFSNPVKSFYTIFQLFTIEGWYEIPNHIAERSSDTIAFFSKLYFSILLFFGGILGFSLVNSIFVDAMVSDNNDELEDKVSQLKDELRSLNQKIDKLLEKSKN
ncbi:MAG TPA: ion transporter [Edaphocola sp.]|nr:ion transporter [Edaphocola sp.]